MLYRELERTGYERIFFLSNPTNQTNQRSNYDSRLTSSVSFQRFPAFLSYSVCLHLFLFFSRELWGLMRLMQPSPFPCHSVLEIIHIVRIQSLSQPRVETQRDLCKTDWCRRALPLTLTCMYKRYRPVDACVPVCVFCLSPLENRCTECHAVYTFSCIIVILDPVAVPQRMSVMSKWGWFFFSAPSSESVTKRLNCHYHFVLPPLSLLHNGNDVFTAASQLLLLSLSLSLLLLWHPRTAREAVQEASVSVYCLLSLRACVCVGVWIQSVVCSHISVCVRGHIFVDLLYVHTCVYELDVSMHAWPALITANEWQSFSSTCFFLKPVPASGTCV